MSSVCSCSWSIGRSSGTCTSLTVMFTSVTCRPTSDSTLLMTLRRAASVSWGIDCPYSMAIVRSMAASWVPTSTLTPLEKLLPPELPPTAPVTLWRKPPTAALALPASTLCGHDPSFPLPYKDYVQTLPVLPTLPGPFLNYQHPARYPAKPAKNRRGHRRPFGVAPGAIGG